MAQAREWGDTHRCTGGSFRRPYLTFQTLPHPPVLVCPTPTYITMTRPRAWALLLPEWTALMHRWVASA